LAKETGVHRTQSTCHKLLINCSVEICLIGHGNGCA